MKARSAVIAAVVLLAVFAGGVVVGAWRSGNGPDLAPCHDAMIESRKVISAGVTLGYLAGLATTQGATMPSNARETFEEARSDFNSPAYFDAIERCRLVVGIKPLPGVPAER